MQYVDLPCEAQVIGSILKWGYKAVAKIENIDSLEFDDYLNSCTFHACMESLKQYQELDYNYLFYQDEYELLLFSKQTQNLFLILIFLQVHP